MNNEDRRQLSLTTRRIYSWRHIILVVIALFLVCSHIRRSRLAAEASYSNGNSFAMELLQHSLPTICGVAYVELRQRQQWQHCLSQQRRRRRRSGIATAGASAGRKYGLHGYCKSCVVEMLAPHITAPAQPERSALDNWDGARTSKRSHAHRSASKQWQRSKRRGSSVKRSEPRTVGVTRL